MRTEQQALLMELIDEIIQKANDKSSLIMASKIVEKDDDEGDFDD